MILVLTGSSKCGKTTLLSSFSKNFSLITETSREVLDNYLEVKELDVFHIQKQIIQLQYNKEESLSKHENFVLDRSLIDYLAFADYMKIMPINLIKVLLPPIKYDFVFLLNQENDTVQKDYLGVSSIIQEKYLEESYQRFGYNPIFVPFINLNKRRKFIEDLIQ